MVPDGRHFVSRARDEASSWRSTYKAPITLAALAGRLGGYVQAYTLYSSVRPFGVTAIVGGWDSEAELGVDGQVGNGPSIGAGGKASDTKAGGPSLYRIEPSGLYWVSMSVFRSMITTDEGFYRDIMAQLQGRAGRQRKQSLKSWI